MPSAANGCLASRRGRSLGSVVVAGRWFEGDHPDLVGVHLDAVGVGSGDVGEVVEADVISVIDLDERFTDRPGDVPYAGGLSEALEDVVEAG